MRKNLIRVTNPHKTRFSVIHLIKYTDARMPHMLLIHIQVPLNFEGWVNVAWIMDILLFNFYRK